MYIVCALYHFVIIDNVQSLKSILQSLCSQHSIQGLILVASEGINGTVAGKREEMGQFIAQLTNDPRFRDIDYKESTSEDMPFYRMNVKIKQELITMKKPEANPSICKGTYVDPKDWNALISDPDVVVIDTRNDYEVSLGRFKNALNPNTKVFSEFPDYVDEELSGCKGTKIAMYCTGGIRCEKASSYMLLKDYPEVYHLKGGILKYLEVIPKEESLWEGNCFVFDHRVSVGHGLAVGGEKLCYACRAPLTAEDQDNDRYEEGVQCAYCCESISEAIKDANRQRQLQMTLAEKRHEKHIGMSEDDVKKRRKPHVNATSVP